MKIDAEVGVESPAEVAELARKAEGFGFDCLWVNETRHDPFVLLALAAGATERIAIGSSIALAFTRSPTTTAYAAWDLQSLSGGRLMLGLGSQVKGHIERRFGMKWEPPVAKMRETIMALRAVWDSWQTGSRLEFHGRFYNLDLMTPFFSPGPIAHPEIPVLVAGVNVDMSRMAGRTADGLHVHPLHTVRYLREALEPAVKEGLTRAKKKREDFTVAASVFAAVGDDRKEIDAVREGYRQQVAFYASTRTYRSLMEMHGWGDTCDRLHERSVKGEWGKMADEISDEVLDAFVVRGTWGELGGEIARRYDGLLDRVRVYLPFDGDAKWKRLVDGFRGGR
ncbi:MAG TPA: TIGR03617 family F420-dependent LLM class oxidoreductase [Nitrososphaerales archaeon]|nr:TIGR03617 family F420-dependent LLM class oxidoreductase [Nitrososphaerales archaeon]